MNNFKLITENKDYWFLINTESDKTLEYPHEWNGCEVVAYKRIINDSFELPLPKLPELHKHECGTVGEADSKKWNDEDINWKEAEREFRKYRQSLDGVETISAYTYWLEHKLPEWLQSLSPKLTPIGFEPEIETDYLPSPVWNGVTEVNRLKVVNGVLQGTYKF